MIKPKTFIVKIEKHENFYIVENKEKTTFFRFCGYNKYIEEFLNGRTKGYAEVFIGKQHDLNIVRNATAYF